MKRILLLSKHRDLEVALNAKWTPSRKRLLICLFPAEGVDEAVRLQAGALGDTMIHMSFSINPLPSTVWLA